MIQNNEFSKEALDILGKTPNSFIRYGLSIFFLILISIIICLYLIEYPDIYQVPVKILSVNSNSHPTEYVAYGEVPAKDIWKIQKDRSVSVSLKAYSKHKFGVLSGKVQAISKPITSLSYKISIKISDGLHSTSGEQLNYLPEMEGIAEFKGKSRNFFQQFFSSNIE